MKFTTSTLVLLAATLAAATQHRRYIVTYDESTPASVVEKAMREAKIAGAHITHEYQIIKGFSVDAPSDSADEFINSLKFGDCHPNVEEDEIVTTQGN